MELWTAFTIGLAGSFHCAGMCGPIAMSLPYGAGVRWKIFLNMLLYNLGRVLTYGIMGALAGAIGKGVALSGYQQALSVALGLLLIVSALLVLFRRRVPLPGGQSLGNAVKNALSKRLKIDGPASLFTIGLLNGFLPCGLVYVGLAGALTTGTLFSGSAYMLLFGLGTLPVMMGMSLAGAGLSLKLRLRLQQLMPVFMLLFGLLFLLRGMDLGIPFISPDLGDSIGAPAKCH